MSHQINRVITDYFLIKKLFKLTTFMSLKHQTKPSWDLNQNDRISNRQKIEGSLKKYYFNLVVLFLENAQYVSPIICYIGETLETLGFLWFLIHPNLLLFENNNFLQDFFLSFLKILNFHEFLMEFRLGVGVGVAVTYILFVVIFLVFLIKFGTTMSTRTTAKKIYLFGCRIILFLEKVISGPLIGLGINLIYCDNNNPYHANHVCYDTQYIFICLLGVFFLAMVIFMLLSSARGQYGRNPFIGDNFSYPNKNYLYSKMVLKIIFPLYFTLRFSVLKLDFLYLICAPILWGLYIFYHRINNLKTFNHRHFYVDLFLEYFLFFTALTVFCVIQFETTPNINLMALTYTLIAGLCGGFIGVCVEKVQQQKFIMKCLQSRVKKQDMYRFILGLIYKLIHAPLKERNLFFQSLSFGLNDYGSEQSSNLSSNRSKSIKKQKYINNFDNSLIIEVSFEEDNKLSKQGKQQKKKKQIYIYLLKIVNKFLQNNSQFNLRIIKCILLRYLGFKYYCLYDLLLLDQYKTNFSQQFIIYSLRQNQQNNTDKQNNNILFNDLDIKTLYNYNEKTTKMKDLMEQCAKNNFQYWQELNQINPSVQKARKLASKYIKYQREISTIYKSLKDVITDCCTPTINYFYFLLEISSDLLTTTEINQILQTQLKKKRQLQEITNCLKIDEICMIALDSVGNKCGNIVNCNNQVKRLLGYKKQSILNKNISRIMPQIYTQLHNNFIYNYVHEKHEKHQQQYTFQHLDNQRSMQKNIFQRIVTPLNSDNYLVEAKLILHLVTNQNNSLIIIGLMNQIQNKEGLIMVNRKDDMILGINKQCSKIIGNTINVNQIVQEQIRIASILPELQWSILNKNQVQTTIIEMSLFQKLSDEFNTSTKIVDVEINRIKKYKEDQLIFLNIRAKQINQSEENMICLIDHKTIKISEDRLKNMNEKSLQKVQVSNYMKEKDVIQLNENLPLFTKMEKYIKDKECDNELKFINILFVVAIIYMTCEIIISFNKYFHYLNEAQQMYELMQIFIDVPQKQAQINYNLNNIWSLSTQNYMNPTNQFYITLGANIKALENDLSSIMNFSTDIQYDLIYNSNIRYNFSLANMINGSIIPQNISFDYYSAVLNYIASAKIILNSTSTTQMMAINPLLVQKTAYYIIMNGDQYIPDLALRAIEAFNSFFRNYGNQHIMMNIKIELMINAGALIIIIILNLVLRNVKDKENKVLEFYSKLTIAQLNILASKCSKYLKNIGKQVKQTKGSSFDFCSKDTVKQFTNNFNNKSEKAHKKYCTSAILQQDEQTQNLKHQTIQGLIQGQNDNLSNTNRIKYCQINSEENLRKNNKKYLLLFILVSVSGILALGSYFYFQFTTNNKLNGRIERLKQIGILIKSMSYLDLYAYRITSNPPNYSYSSMISAEASLFYSSSTKTYKDLSNPVFSDVYGTIETLQQYYTKPEKYPLSFLRHLYSTVIHIKLQKACQKLVELDRLIFKPEFDRVLEEQLKIQLILLAVIWMTGFLYYILSKYMAIHKRQQTINMLRIIPIRVVRMNNLVHEELS